MGLVQSYQHRSLGHDMTHILNTTSLARLVVASCHQFDGEERNAESFFGCNVIEPLRRPADPIPKWSPATPDASIPIPLDILFPSTFFACIRAAPPSPTLMRHFNEKVARLRKRGLAPEWMPNQKFSPIDMPHLLALAFTRGAWAGLDLADLMSDMPKLLKKLGEAATRAGDIMDRADGRRGAVKALVLTAALSMIGLHFIPYSPFFKIVQDPRLNDCEEVIILFNWITEGLGEQAINREARRAMQRSDVDADNARAATLTLYPNLDRLIEEANHYWEEIRKELFPTDTPEAINSDVISTNGAIAENPQPVVGVPKVRFKNVWEPAVPEGVVLTGRAIREIRRERRFAEDRLADGLQLLGMYRSMRIGSVSFDVYRDAVRQEYFEDTPCFADVGSLKAFEQDYSVVVEGSKYVLDRHLKWGKGNNVVSAIRIYYTWDASNQQVIVGSVPRHLPIWARH